MDETKWLTIRQASDLTGYSEMYIQRLAREGKIRTGKFGIQWMIDPTDLQAYKARKHEKRD